MNPLIYVHLCPIRGYILWLLVLGHALLVLVIVLAIVTTGGRIAHFILVLAVVIAVVVTDRGMVFHNRRLFLDHNRAALLDDHGVPLDYYRPGNAHIHDRPIDDDAWHRDRIDHNRRGTDPHRAAADDQPDRQNRRTFDC